MVEYNGKVFWTWLESIDQGKYFASIGNVDIAKGEINDFLRLGSDGKKQLYFLNTKFPHLQVSDGQIVYFGNDAKGKNIWFCRVNFE